MGLLDQMLSAKGEGSTDYAKAGRHLVKLTRAYLRDPAEDPSVEKAGGGFDGALVHSNRADFGQVGGNAKGDVIRVNDGFKFKGTALARMRRGAAAAATAKAGKQVDETTFGLTQNPKETNDAFIVRITDEIKRLFGPTQPLREALVIFSVTVRKNQTTGGEYSLFEVEAPTMDDLVAAGIVPAAKAAQPSA